MPSCAWGGRDKDAPHEVVWKSSSSAWPGPGMLQHPFRGPGSLRGRRHCCCEPGGGAQPLPSPRSASSSSPLPQLSRSPPVTPAAPSALGGSAVGIRVQPCERTRLGGEGAFWGLTPGVKGVPVLQEAQSPSSFLASLRCLAENPGAFP